MSKQLNKHIEVQTMESHLAEETGKVYKYIQNYKNGLVE